MNSPLDFRSALVLCVMKSFCKLLICAKMIKFSSFVTANSFLAFLPLFVKEAWCLPTLPIVKVTKAWSAGEPILITLVSKETVAAGAWVSHSPTSCTQNLFPKS